MKMFNSILQMAGFICLGLSVLDGNLISVIASSTIWIGATLGRICDVLERR